MSYPLNYPTPQGANIQIFQAPVRAAVAAWTTEWVKPQGASMVWFTLIGAGGGGGGVDATNSFFGAGGGSGAVTNCMVPAFLIPDVLQIRVGAGGAAGTTATSGGSGTITTVFYQQKASSGYTLLTANGGAGGAAGTGGGSAPSAAGGAASTSTNFSAAGFFQSVAGQDSTTSGTSQTPSATTFLSGGTAGSVTANYGYTSNAGFRTQPIIVGAGRTTSSGRGPIGCGGWSNGTLGLCGTGGDGLVVIVTW